MKLRVYAENEADDRRQEVVGYAEVDGEARRLSSIVQQADPAAAARAVAAVIAVGLHAAGHVDPEAVHRELDRYEETLEEAAQELFPGAAENGDGLAA